MNNAALRGSMASYHLVMCVLLLLFARVGHAVKGATTECCEIAKPFALGPPPNVSYVCGQSYLQESNGSILAAAPELNVDYTWCTQYCGSYTLYKANDANDWALPLFSFILAAVIFSTAIPRQRTLPLLRRSALPSKKNLNWVAKWVLNAIFLSLDPFIIIIDTSVWVFVIMAAAGPFMLSGLIELSLDITVVQNATNANSKKRQKSKKFLPPEERFEVLTAVLAGNLLKEADVNKTNSNTNGTNETTMIDPQEEMKYEFSRNPGTRVNSLLSMLESQASFGGAVGAAVLLYLGQFGYSLLSLRATKGDKATARALAFGIWWMTTVHVSVIGASLLASNNPSTAAAIVGRRPGGRRYFWTELEYDTRFKPAWMPFRGKSKIEWLQNTSAWRHPWFKDLIYLKWQLVILVFWTCVLVGLPCGLAIWIEYRTPPVSVGCRTMTIILYVVVQIGLLGFSVFDHYKALRPARSVKWMKKSGRTCCRNLLSFIRWSFFTLGLVATFVGTLMQITGIFQNCWCAADHSFSWLRPTTVSLATDTQKDRDSASSWNAAGLTAVIFLALVTYIGWWGQRYIRDTFIARAEALETPLAVDAGGAHEGNVIPPTIPPHQTQQHPSFWQLQQHRGRIG